MKWVCTILVITVLDVSAQDFGWWANLVKWDGVTPWQRYIKTVPAFMGPNALPVPFITNGSIDTINSVGITGNFHFSKGDNTQNIAVYANYAVSDVIAFDLYWVPYERYQMSHAIKEDRHVFSHYYYDKSARGDIHLNTNIQLLKKLRDKIHLALRFGYRLPTSKGLGTARFTDAPGYYADLSVAKPFEQSNWKFIGMAGLFIWQTNLDGRRQDDAFLFGAGIEYGGNWKWQLYGTGYLGYLNQQGDKPILLRTSLEQRNKKLNAMFRFQQGLHNFKYSTIEGGIRYIFSH